MSQPQRNPVGGLIARDQPLRFLFDGRRLDGYAGDTLASALLANGERLIARSFKYHRPRGVFAIGAEEPNALVELGDGAWREPNSRATQIELYEGLIARPQNCWPSLRFDLLAASRPVAGLLSAGFYYKTFMKPQRWWPAYERWLRRAAGMGRAAAAADPETYDSRHAHCDVLVVGAGPSGIAAAIAAAGAGARVVLVDEQPRVGGWLRREADRLDDQPAHHWAEQAVAELVERSAVRLLTRTTAFGYYDHNLVGLIERVADHVPPQARLGPRQRLWRVRAAQIVLATGAVERPLLFSGNDRPGIMLAGAARAYLHEYAVRAGRRAVVVTNNDSAYRSAFELQAGGVEVAAIVELRADISAALQASVGEHDVPLQLGARVVRAIGSDGLAALELASAGGRRRRIDCDLACVSGGWVPSVHLHAQSGGRPAYDEGLMAFVPGLRKQAERSAGAASGRFALADCLADGYAAGTDAAVKAGFAGPPPPALPSADRNVTIGGALAAQTLRPADTPRSRGKVFVDLQNDVTADDVHQAWREGYVSVEHLKRYTTLGMGTDQGKTSNLNGLALLAGLRAASPQEIGTTTFRPPYTPVTLGALAGIEPGPRLQPTRRTPLHAEHGRLDAVFAALGLWLRPQYYPQPGESAQAAVRRECTAVRSGVGICDVSTLGKIELGGRDVVEFLGRVYTNAWDTLPVGRIRYGIMLREDGMILDDGTVSRLAERRWFVTTTSANAELVLQHLEYLLDVVWPELDVQLVPVAEQWAAVAVAGPASRELLTRVCADVALTADAFPHLAVRSGRVAGSDARLLRVSYSGEPAWEIYVAARHGAALWCALLEAGRELGVTPYGLDALEALRIEKGYIAIGAEADGRASPHDVGLGRLLSPRKPCIGGAMLNRPALRSDERLQLIGLVPVDGLSVLHEGGQLLPSPDAPAAPIGHVSSAAWSVSRDGPIALAMLIGGRERHGETVHVADPVRGGEPVAARVTEPCFYDPAGERLRD